MKKITLRKWQLGVLVFIPFLGIINPVLYVAIFALYFVGIGTYFLMK